jgi:uncharacterized RDD family membrane protein YckC
MQWVIIIITTITVSVLRESMGVWLALIINFLVDWFYHVICELTLRGQSLGKRMRGLRVVKNDGSPVDPSASFLRNLLRFADTFFFCFPIAFISIAASRGFKRIGDWAGGTLVVYSSMAKNNPRSSLSLILEKYEPITPSRPLSGDEKEAVINFARRYPLLGEARANEIAGIYAPYLKKDDSLTDAAFLLGVARKLSGEI